MPARRTLLKQLGLAALGATALLATSRRLHAEPAPGLALDLDWHDPARDRAVPARLYLPAAASAAAPVPLVLFSHGIGGSRRGYQYLGRHWAAHGWASLHPQHVGSDRRLWGGNPLAMLGRLRDAATDEEAVARVLDMRFALDTLLASELGRSVDARQIVAAGHSYGANTALLAAGARVPRGGRVQQFTDTRLRAAMLLSAPPFYGERTFGPILSGITMPSLHITSTDDDIRIPGFFSGVDDRIAVFEAIGSRPKALAVFEGGSHSMFTDRAGTGGPLLNAQVKAATQALTLAFLQQVFQGEGQALAQWPRQHTEILARFSFAAEERVDRR